MFTTALVYFLETPSFYYSGQGYPSLILCNALQSTSFDTSSLMQPCL